MKPLFYLLFLLLPKLFWAQQVENVIPLRLDSFQVIYDGHGSIRFASDGGELLFSPMASTQSTETHAALLLIQESVKNPLSNFTLEVTASTETQLRKDQANPWEGFWIFFNYNSTSPHLQKETNYFVHKTNGVELGRAYGEREQQFLVTHHSLPLQLMKSYRYKITKDEHTIKIWIDDEMVINYTWDSTSSSTPFLKQGYIGFYSEDAKIKIQKCSLYKSPTL